MKRWLGPALAGAIAATGALAGGKPDPAQCANTPEADLPALIDELDLHGRLHDDATAVCVQRLDDWARQHPDAVAEALLARARHADATGDPDAALAGARQAWQRSSAGGPSRARADAMLGKLATLSENLDEGERHLADALAADPGPGTRLRALLALGWIKALRRDRESCLEQAEAAIALAARHYGENHTASAQALIVVAACRRLSGEHGASLQALERVLAIEPPGSPDGNARLAAEALLMRAQTHKIVGDFAEAGRGYRRTLDHLATYPEPVPYLLASALHGLANLERDENRVEQSLPLYEEAVAVIRRVYGERSSRTFHALNNYGNALGLAGRHDDAIAVYEQALTLVDAQGADRDPAASMAIANIALVRLWQGRYEEAESGFRQALVLSGHEAPGAENSPDFPMLGLASALWGQGQHAQALALAERAERQRQLAVAATWSTLSEDAVIRYQEYLRPGLDLAIAVAHDSGDGDLIERAWTLAMSARGQVTTETATRLAAARGASDPDIRAELQRWQRVHLELARLRLAPGDDDAGRARLDAARRAVHESERALAGVLPTTAAQLDPVDLDLARLRSTLPDDAVLVSYVSSILRGAGDYAHRDAHTRPGDLYAFVADGDSPPRLLRLLDERELEVLVDRWRAALKDPTSGEQTLNRTGTHLRRRIFDPLAIAEDRLLLVVPHRDLHQINFAALPAADGRYLLEHGLRPHTLNHERELLRPAPARNEAPRVLAVSDPDFGDNAPAGQGDRADACTDGWPSLPGSRREVRSLRALLPTRASVTSLQGGTATRANVLAQLPDRDLIHLATHGLRRGNACQAATRGLSLAPASIPGDTEVSGTGVLILADDGGNGFLSESDIAVLSLERAQWVVLSACDTGLADSRAYEGAFGLRRAFHLAGARTVIMSLWPVHDQATADWMAALYRARLREQVDTPTALHSAQRAVLERRRANGQSDHPYYWAAFVAAGDWR